MNKFRKKIQGIDFEFDLHNGQQEPFCYINGDGVALQMRIDENGLWKIEPNGELPPKVLKLEYKLGKAIDQAMNSNQL